MEVITLKRSFSSLLLLICLIVAGPVPAQASSIPAGFNSWPLQTTTDTNKVWTVKFSLPLDSSKVNRSCIYVTDDSNQPVNTTLTRSSDGTSVQVFPSSAYLAGKKYWLFITNGLTASSGKNVLTQPIAVPFIVTAGNSKIIQITESSSSLLTSFTVVTSPDVFTVKINSTGMIYQGNNTYSLGMSGLKTGSIVTVYAYDSSGKLLGSQKYTIN
jgi:hypothetical protein